MIGFTILGDPRGKGRPKFGNGHAYTDDKTVSYENLVGYTAASAMKSLNVPMFEAPVDVTLQAWLSIPTSWSNKKKLEMDGRFAPKKPDSDNMVKIIMDALNGVVWKDDVQVCRLTVEKRYSHRPRVDVMVREAEDLF